MARSSLGSLVVSLGLNAVEFVSGLSRAEYQAQKSLSNISRQMESVGHTFHAVAGLIGVGFGVHELVEFATEVTHAAEAIGDLATSTGSSVENLSQLRNAVAIAGVSGEEFNAVIERFAAGLGGAGEGATKVAAAMKYLGVTSKDPATAMLEAALAMDKLTASSNKAALARDAFGRSGVAFQRGLKSIAESNVGPTLTAEQVENAEKLLIVIRQLQIESHKAADIFLNDFAPSITAIISKFVEARNQTDSFIAGLKVFSNLGLFSTPAEDVARLSKEVDDLEQSIARVKARGPISIFGMTISGREDTSNLEANLATAKKALAVAQALADKQTVKPPKDTKPSRYVSPSANADDPARKLLEGQLKALERAVEQEKAALAARADYLRDYYQDGYLSAAQYYAKLADARAAELDNVLGYYDKEIAAAEAFKRNAAKATDRTEAQNKIDELRDKQAKAIRDAGYAEENLGRERNRAAEQYKQQLDEINARLLEMQGNTAAAAKIRFDSQNVVTRRQLASSGDTAQLDALNALEAQAVNVARLNDAQREYARTLSDVGDKQARIDIEQQTGAITEIDAINKRADLARQYIGILNAQIDAQAQIARTLTGPELDAALERIKQMRLEVVRLSTATGELAKKFNDVFVDAFTDAFTAVATGTKSVSQAFKDMEKQIVAAISRIAAQNLAQAIFGAGGAGAGIGGFFAQLFGGGGTGAGIGYGAAGSAIPAGPFPYASGTSYHPGGWAKVGERGPELVKLPRGSQVVPNDKLPAARSTSLTIVNNFPQGTSRQTIGQASAATAKAARRGLDRYA